MLVGQAYRFLIYDQKFACRLDRKWVSPAEQTANSLSDEETMQLIMGMTYSIKNMLLKLTPAKNPGSTQSSPTPSRRSSVASPTIEQQADEPILQITLPSEVCYSYVASKYRLSYYESMTRWKLVLLSEPTADVAPGEIEAFMSRLYSDVFLRHIVHNPVYRMDEPSFARPGLLARLDDFLKI